MSSIRISRLLLMSAILLGLFLRVIHPADMEWKEDEQYHYAKSQSVGVTEPWPWVGIPSGVYLVNPGMSVWTFASLAKLTHSKTPTDLMQALGVLSWFGILTLVFFGRLAPGLKDSEREALYWASALAFVNPIAVWYQRKLWPEGFFMLFSTLFLGAWYFRHRKWGAFSWGFIGALLGQIHMSGFFSAFGFFIWTLFFGKKTEPKKTPQWAFWVIGSALGALPLIPWLHFAFTHPLGGPLNSGWDEIVQLKFWVFWLSDPFGLHLGNTLGIHLGNSHFAQLSDFIRYPILWGTPTYLCGLAHLILLGLVIGLLLKAIPFLVKNVTTLVFKSKQRDLDLGLRALWFGFGLSMTLTGIRIRRYYLAVSFPFQFLFLIKWVSAVFSKHARSALLLLWIAQAVISCVFIDYIHRCGGSEKGDYGISYERALKNP